MMLKSFLESLSPSETECPTGPEDWVFLLARKRLFVPKQKVLSKGLELFWNLENLPHSE